MRVTRSNRALTLIEMIMVSAIVVFFVGATLRVISVVQSLRERSGNIAALSLRANAEIEKLKMKPFDEIQPGKHALPSLPERQSGEIVITEIHPGGLKQIVVTLRTASAKDIADVTLTTLVAKPIAK
jgi:hypothetical protein